MSPIYQAVATPAMTVTKQRALEVVRRNGRLLRFVQQLEADTVAAWELEEIDGTQAEKDAFIVEYIDEAYQERVRGIVDQQKLHTQSPPTPAGKITCKTPFLCIHRAADASGAGTTDPYRPASQAQRAYGQGGSKGATGSDTFLRPTAALC
jgi:hypothetical protein